MLLDIVMESFLSMDDESKLAVIESMSPEELDIVSDYIDSVMDTDSVLESIYDALASMDDDELAATLESFSDEELDYLVANEGLFKSQYEKAAANIAAASKSGDNTDLTGKIKSGLKKAGKTLNSPVDVVASNLAYKLKNGTTKNAKDPASSNAETDEIKRKIAEANKRGAELKRSRAF